MVFYMMEKQPWKTGSILSRILEFGRVWWCKKVYSPDCRHEQQEAYRLKSKGRHISWYWKRDNEYKGSLPWTVLYKSTCVLKVGSGSAREEEVGVYVLRCEEWLSPDGRQDGWKRNRRNSRQVLPRQQSLQVYSRFNTLNLRRNCNFNYTFGISEN